MKITKVTITHNYWTRACIMSKKLQKYVINVNYTASANVHKPLH